MEAGERAVAPSRVSPRGPAAGGEGGALSAGPAGRSDPAGVARLVPRSQYRKVCAPAGPDKAGGTPSDPANQEAGQAGRRLGIMQRRTHSWLPAPRGVVAVDQAAAPVPL